MHVTLLPVRINLVSISYCSSVEDLRRRGRRFRSTKIDANLNTWHSSKHMKRVRFLYSAVSGPPATEATFSFVRAPRSAVAGAILRDIPADTWPSCGKILCTKKSAAQGREGIYCLPASSAGGDRFHRTNGMFNRNRQRRAM